MSASLIDSLEDDENLIIYSIGALDNTPLRGKTKLQKLLFLISNVFCDIKEVFEFEPHLFGPYSEKIDHILDDLITLGIVYKNGNSYRLTEKGIQIYENLKPKKELVDVIDDFKDFLNDLSEDQMLVFIYIFYPKYVEESAVWDRLKKDRVKVAMSLLKKQKVSFSKAAEIAGLNINEFENLLKENRIRWRA